MTDTNTLAPCPFCGERAETDFIPEHHSYQIECSDSIGCTALITRDSELGAIEAWNCRAALAAPAQPVSEPSREGQYAELPEHDATTVGLGCVWNRHSMRAFADATHALRASHGQAPAPGEPSDSASAVHKAINADRAASSVYSRSMDLVRVFWQQHTQADALSMTMAELHTDVELVIRAARGAAQAAPVDAAKLPSPANVDTAPKCLNLNDQAMWVLGWNECLDAARAAQKGGAA